MRKAPIFASSYTPRVAAALLMTIAVSGCEMNFREELGIHRQGPDPFTVVASKPLEMPTEKKTLPKPQPGAASRVAPTPQADARRALTGKDAAATSAPSAAETALLQRTGANSANNNIRQILADEQSDTSSWRLLDDLLGSSEDLLEEALDPEEEARRLAEQKKATSAE